MTLSTAKSTRSLYDQDYYLWLEETIKQLRSGYFSALDLENLIEELESMGRSEKRAIKSLLTRLLEHLLKLTYWHEERDYNANKWKSEITNFRTQIIDLLQDSPSLKPYLGEIFDKCHEDANQSMSQLIGARIPSTKVFTLKQTLEQNLSELKD